MELQARPVYRHVVVQRRGLIEKVADPDQFRRLREQVEAGLPVDDDIKHLVVNDTLKQTMRKVFGWAGHGDVAVEGVDGGVSADNVMSEADLVADRQGDERKVVQYQRQEGYIVSRIVQDQMPGGGSLPAQPTVLHHPGFESAEDPQSEFLDCAKNLLETFNKHSDRKFLLLDESMRASVTLVTVIETPIIAIPRPDQGVELICEFHQKSCFGHVDTTGFEVFSETGEYPIQPPNGMDLMSMMATADRLVPSGG